MHFPLSLCLLLLLLQQQGQRAACQAQPQPVPDSRWITPDITYDYLYHLLPNTSLPSLSLGVSLLSLPPPLPVSLSLPWQLRFYGSYDAITISAYGMVRFNPLLTGQALISSQESCEPSQRTMTCEWSGSSYSNALAVNAQTYTNVQQQQQGTSANTQLQYAVDTSNQVLTVQWSNLSLPSGSGSGSGVLQRFALQILRPGNATAAMQLKGVHASTIFQAYYQQVSFQNASDLLLGLRPIAGGVALRAVYPPSQSIANNSMLQYCPYSTDLCVYPTQLPTVSTANRTLYMTASDLTCFAATPSHGLVCTLTAADSASYVTVGGTNSTTTNISGSYDAASRAIACVNVPSGIGTINVSLVDTASGLTLLTSSTLQYTYNISAQQLPAASQWSSSQASQYCSACGDKTGNEICSRDCANVLGGSAVEDGCGSCVGGSTNRVANDVMNCAGICYGTNLATSQCSGLQSCSLQYSLSASNSSYNATAYSSNAQTTKTVYGSVTVSQLSDACSAVAQNYQYSSQYLDYALNDVSGFTYCLLALLLLALVAAPLYTWWDNKSLRRYQRVREREELREPLNNVAMPDPAEVVQLNDAQPAASNQQT